MALIQASRNVEFQPKQMFDLVADVERYPEFVPFCDRLIVLKRVRNSVYCEEIVAAMSIRYATLSESYTSKIFLDAENNTIEVHAIDGPFSHLVTTWKFEPKMDGASIHFILDYQFRNRVLQTLMGSMLDKIFEKFVSAFLQRAEIIYASDRLRQ